MKRKRKRLRVDRIIICLAILIILILLIKFGIYTIRCIIINNAANDGDIIKVYNSDLTMWDKTFNYIKENKEEVTIEYDDNYVTLNTKDLKQDMNISLNTFTEYIDKPLFNNVKSHYIKSNDILNKSSKIKVKIPGYLLDHKYVDVYKVVNDKIQLYKSTVSTKDEYVSFKTEKDTDYFICYIPIKSISASAIKINENEEKYIKLSFNPSNATNTNVSYSIEDEDIISIKNSKVVGKKAGSTTITVKSEEENITKEIKVTINKVEEEKPKEEPKKEETNKQEVKNGYLEVIDGITYVDGIMMVNKTYSLPDTYDPGGLTDEFMAAFEEMKAAAANDGIDLFIASGYRDYNYQVELYEKYVSVDGIELADTYSARPGHSEHQTGLTADINSADESFEGTPEAIWLDQNCYKFGFIVRYPKGKDAFTGYEYEPWHLRFIGKEKAKIIYDSGLSLEEYYGLKSEYID